MNGDDMGKVFRIHEEDENAQQNFSRKILREEKTLEV